MPQIIDLGKIRFSYKGAYSASVQYVQNDIVTYGANAYVYTNTTASTGNTPTNTTYWSIMTAGLQFEGNWSNSASYQANDIVTFGGKSYVALRDTVADVPSTSPSDWDLLNDGIRHMGPWAASASYYYPGDVVTRGGSQYIALTYHEPTASFATDLGDGDWAEFVRGTRFRGAWVANTAYLKDDIVSDGVNTHVATLDFTSNPVNFASETGGYWVEFTEGSSELPPQTGNENYLLTTDGTDPFWSDSINLSGSAQIDGLVQTGLAATTWGPVAELTGPMVIMTTAASGNAYNQVAIHSEDPEASTDLIIYNDSGVDAHGWIDIGITGSGFVQEEFGITGPDNGYIFFEAPDGTTGTGNLVFATGDKGTENRIVFGAGGFATGLEQMIIIPDEQVHIEIATESTSPTTGALRVAGGAGLSGNLNVLGDVRIQGSLEVFGGAFETETLVSTNPLFTTGTGATNDTPDRGFLVETKMSSSSASFEIGQVSASGGFATIVRKGFTTLTKARTGGTATIQVQEASHSIQNGDTVVIANLGAPYDGTQTITGVTGTTFSFAAAGEQSATADTDGTVTVNIPSQFVNGDSITVSGCSVSALNGQRNFVETVSGNTLTVDFTGTQALVSASGTVTVNTKTAYSGLFRDSANDQWYLIDNHPTAASGALRLAPSDSINLGSAGLTYPTLNIGGLAFAGATPTIAGNITLSGNLTLSGNNTYSGTTALSGGGSLAGTFTGNPTLSDNPTFSGNPVFSGAPSFTGTPVFTGGVRVQEMIEDVVEVSPSSNVYTLDYTQGGIFYSTGSLTGNFTVNITNAPTDNGRILTINHIITQGATGYRPGTLNINGSGVSIKWPGGVVPTPTSSNGKLDIFTYTIIRRGSSFDALVSANLNF